MRSRHQCDDSGSAVVEAVLVLAGLASLLLGLLQIAVTAWTQTYVSGVAADSARAAAASGDYPQVEQRLREQLSMPFFSTTRTAVHSAYVSGLAVAEVDVSVRVSRLAPIGPREIRVVRHALIDD